MDADPVVMLQRARAALASACLGGLSEARLGEITLRPDQRLLAARAQRLIDTHHGCLVAEEVGRGKTFVALALARARTSPIAVVPSPLVSTWEQSMQRTGVPCAITTHDALSRGHAPDASQFDFVIVDESHHFRTADTRRYRALTRLAACADIVLLSATPLQNRLCDLAVQIALFHGAAAHELNLDALNRFVVRSAGGDDAQLPDVALPEWLAIDECDDAVVEAILALPNPVRPRDAGDEGALRTIALVRAWASSRAALRTALRRRRRVATALEQALSEGVLPTRDESRAWLTFDDDVQLGMVPLLVSARPASDVRLQLDRLVEEQRALDELARVLRATSDPDVARVSTLRRLRGEYPGCRLLVFSEFASTVGALYAALRHESRVGMLTSHEARIASGPIARQELLARFAPAAQGGLHYAPHEQVTLLLATDLLSEGLNLQDANIVVHLDLPWNPARLAQRLGRVRRAGAHREVRSFLFAPPASAATLLDIHRRLRTKAALATALTGEPQSALPTLTREDVRDLDVGLVGSSLSSTARGELIDILGRWGTSRRSHAPCRAAVGSNGSGWLAAFADGTMVVHLLPCGADTFQRAFEAVAGAAVPMDSSGLVHAEAALSHWMRAHRTHRAAGVESVPGELRTACLQHLDRIARDTVRHQRGRVFPLVSRLKMLLQSPLSLGMEQQLLAELCAPTFDAEPLWSVLIESVEQRLRQQPDAEQLVALILIGTVTAQNADGASQAADPVVLQW